MLVERLAGPRSPYRPQTGRSQVAYSPAGDRNEFINVSYVADDHWPFWHYTLPWRWRITIYAPLGAVAIILLVIGGPGSWVQLLGSGLIFVTFIVLGLADYLYWRSTKRDARA